MERTHANSWWNHGREESAAVRHEMILIDQLEWLPEQVLTQLIAPAKNDDIETPSPERRTPRLSTHPAT